MRQYFLQPISLSSHLLPTDLVNYSFKQELIVFCFLSSYCQIQFAPHGRNSFIRFLSCPQREVFAIFHQGKNFFSLLEEFKNCEERKVYFSKEYTKMVKRNTCCILLRHGKVGEIIIFFCLERGFCSCPCCVYRNWAWYWQTIFLLTTLAVIPRMKPQT